MKKASKILLAVALSMILAIGLMACGGGGGSDNNDDPGGNNSASSLPDTGQTACYDALGVPIDCAGTGQDGEYSINPMGFTNSPDGTVSDNVTGLMWQKCSAGLNGDATCTGTASSMTWQTALDYCNGLSLAGHTDWRLPTKKELMGIVDYGTYNPSIDTAVFPNTILNYYWTSVEGAGNPALYAWIVSFYNGLVGSFTKAGNYYARCVRGSTVTQSFTNNGDGTVTDNVTDLMWQRCSAGLSGDATCSGTVLSMSWQAALDYCNGLSLAGFTDWRLPNVKELESITDDAIYNPAIDEAVFPNTIGLNYWSSTTYAGLSSYVWGVYFYYSGNDFLDRANSHYVRCVR